MYHQNYPRLTRPKQWKAWGKCRAETGKGVAKKCDEVGLSFGSAGSGVAGLPEAPLVDAPRGDGARYVGVLDVAADAQAVQDGGTGQRGEAHPIEAAAGPDAAGRHVIHVDLGEARPRNEGEELLRRGQRRH